MWSAVSPTLLVFLLITSQVAFAELLRTEQEALLEFLNYMAPMGQYYNESNVANVCDTYVPQIIEIRCQNLDNDTETLTKLWMQIDEDDNVLPPDDVFAAFTNLNYLYIGHTTRPSGQFPHSVFNNPNLKRLEVNFGIVLGTLPEWNENTSLQYIDLTEQALSGTIPASWATPTNLSVLILDFNSLSCPIPEQLVSIQRTRCSIQGLPGDEKGLPCSQDVLGKGCTFLPVTASYPTPSAAPLVTTRGEQIYVEVYDRQIYTYALTKSGKPFRDEYMIFDIQGFGEFISRARTLHEQLVEPFKDYTVDEKGIITLTRNGYNSGSFTVKIEPLVTSIKLSFGLQNLTRKNPQATYIGVAMQLTYIAPIARAESNWTLNCNKLFCQGPEFTAISGGLLENRLSMEIKSKKTELKYDFQHDYYYGPNYTLQGEIYVPKIYPMFTPYGTLRWMRATGPHVPPSDVNDQSVSISFWVYFYLGNETSFWYDPDFSLTLLFDSSEPSSSGSNSTVAVALGVAIPLVLAVVLVVVALSIPSVRNRLAPFSKQRSKIVVPLQTNSDISNIEMQDKKQWESAKRPMSFSNVDK